MRYHNCLFLSIGNVIVAFTLCMLFCFETRLFSWHHLRRVSKCTSSVAGISDPVHCLNVCQHRLISVNTTNKVSFFDLQQPQVYQVTLRHRNVSLLLLLSHFFSSRNSRPLNWPVTSCEGFSPQWRCFRSTDSCFSAPITAKSGWWRKRRAGAQVAVMSKALSLLKFSRPGRTDIPWCARICM